MGQLLNLNTGRPVHDFRERLQYSEDAKRETFWIDAFTAAFDSMVACVPLKGDTQSQRQGKDWAIHLSNGNVIYLDVKTRSRKSDSDIALEYEHRTPAGRSWKGWMEEDKAIDYIAYGFVPLRRVYLLPWLELRRAWQQNRYAWLNTHFIAEAPNRGYTSYSVAVPTDILREAVASAALINF